MSSSSFSVHSSSTRDLHQLARNQQLVHSYPLEAPAEVIAPDLLSRAAEVIDNTSLSYHSAFFEIASLAVIVYKRGARLVRLNLFVCVQLFHTHGILRSSISVCRLHSCTHPMVGLITATQLRYLSL